LFENKNKSNNYIMYVLLKKECIVAITFIAILRATDHRTMTFYETDVSIISCKTIEQCKKLGHCLTQLQ